MRKVCKDFPNYEVCSAGFVYSIKSGIRLKGLCLGGRLQVSIYKNGKQFKRLVHRLVAEAFIPRASGKIEVNHINGIQSDNRIENLEWVTPSENILHAYRVLKRNMGNKKISSDEVIEIKEMLSIGVLQSEIAKKFNVTQSNISLIKTGKSRGGIA